MSAAEGRALVEWDWLTGPSASVLHHVALTDEQAEEMADESQLGDVPVTTTCGRVLWNAQIPGPLTRMGTQRCQRCCDRLGYPRGVGSPKNDEVLRRFVDARLQAMGVAA
jgi:hypothetical protein